MSDIDCWKPTAVIIGPGGLKGFMYLGALRALDTYKYLDNVTSWIGVSVGSMISLMIICGYTMDEIIKIANHGSITGDLINAIVRLINLDRLVPDKGILYLLNEKVTEKFGKVLTFKELYDKTGIEFTAISLNADMGSVVYFNHENHPNLSVTIGVAASIGVPGVFPLLEYDDDIYTDGALGNPYPVSYYKDSDHKVLGIYVDNLIPPRIERTKGFGAELLMTIRTYIAIITYLQRDKYIINKNASPANVKHLTLRCVNSITLNSNLSTDEKAFMLVEGWSAASLFIENMQ